MAIICLTVKVEPAHSGGELQIPRLSPDFLSSLVASLNLVRLSWRKAAYVTIDWYSVIRNPERAPGFPVELVALANLMRLSLLKAAHAVWMDPSGNPSVN